MIQIIYNSKYSYDDFGIIAKIVNRPLLPTKRRNSVAVPGRHGTYDFSDDTYENVVIPVLVQCLEDTFPNARARARQISAWLGQRSYSPLIFTDEPDKYYMGKIFDSASLEQILELLPGEKTTINFECQPFALSVELDLWVARLSSAISKIQNGGTYEVSPVITIGSVVRSGGTDRAVEVTGAFNPADPIVPTLTNPAITVGDNTLVYTGTLTEGQSLILNSETFQATKGGANVLDKISGEWPVLEIGNNNVSIVDTTSECGATVEILYRKRWL